MRISELSRTSGVSVASIKYYLREGLLPPGAPTAPNQAEYGDEQLHRLRLIRILLEIGGLSIADVRSVVAAIEDPALPLHEVLGAGHRLLGPRDEEAKVSGEARAARGDVDRFVERLGWHVSPDAPSRQMLADALLALRRLGWDLAPEAFDRYAEAADRLAEQEVERTPVGASRAEMVEYMVVGTVVFEAVLAALRRMAQEHYSAERFSSLPPEHAKSAASGRPDGGVRPRASTARRSPLR
jgi:DNA-binding transcriptional MerR regulator